MSILRQSIPHQDLQDMLAQSKWYHQFDFPDGLQQSQATYNLRPYLPHYHLPSDLNGKRVLDVGTADGFFAFLFKQKGAEQVRAIDINAFDGSLGSAASPKHEQHTRKYSIFTDYYQQFPQICQALGLNTFNRFRIAQDLLGLDVEYREQSVYELKASGEKFDLVFCGDLIEHLKNPLEALENLMAATGERCIISLSGALEDKRDRSLKSRIFHRLVGDSQIRAAHWVEYIGNTSGGAFFRFHPLAFREALLASGFQGVEMVSEFDLPNLQHNILNHHAVFHCYV